MLHTDVDMSQVPEEGEIPADGAYLVRVSEVKETDSAGNPLLSNKGEPKVVIIAKIQDEGKYTGFPITFHASLLPHALRTLKAIYGAVGYTPGPEGHDPQNILDGEFYVYGEAQEYDKPDGSGKGKSFNIAPWNIKSVAQGPPKLRS